VHHLKIPSSQGIGAMNKFVNVILVVVAALTVLAAYWYLNPHHMPRLISDLVSGLKAPKSPVANFRPPQF
jgi:hypothetical protein